MRSAVIACGVLAGCAGSIGADAGLEDLAITGVEPSVIVPGTRVVVSGASFVGQEWGAAALRLQGTAGRREIDRVWPARSVDSGRLDVAIDAGMFAEVAGGDGDVEFRGVAIVEVTSAIDRETY